MLVDLHTHTLHYSFDSSLTVDGLAARAKARGLDGVCLTEHNAAWDRERLEGIGARHGVTILCGIEVATQYGHVLVFGVPRFSQDMWQLERLREVTLAEGGVMVLAHPHRKTDLLLQHGEMLTRYFDAIEVLNGHDSAGSTGYVPLLATSAGLPGTGGSDAHSLDEIGVCVTRFDVPITSEADLVRELRGGRVSAVRLG